MPSIIDVSKFVLEESAGTCRPVVSTMKLQKMCYFVQGWHLVINGYPMFAEDFHAWKYGPVCPELYELSSGKALTDTDSAEFANITPRLNDYQQDFIKKIFGIYNPYSGLQLSDITRNHDAWKNAGAGTHKDSEDSLMSKDSIHNDFITIMKSI
jgi:putative toxin-antitoxin system, antitoxin component, xre family